MVTITRTSPFTGKVNTMELPISEATYTLCMLAWNAGDMIQDAFPMLDAGQREFIKTGITPQEWDALFGSEEE
jgi:hypothetical protein